MAKETLLIRLLPYQKLQLHNLAEATGKTQTELVREAITVLLGQYREMGVFHEKATLDKTVDRRVA